MEPSNQIFHKASVVPCVVLYTLIPSLLLFLNNTLSLSVVTRLLLKASVTIFLSIILLSAPTAPEISNKYLIFHFPAVLLSVACPHSFHLFLTINFLHLLYWQSCRFFVCLFVVFLFCSVLFFNLALSSCIGLNPDGISLYF